MGEVRTVVQSGPGVQSGPVAGPGERFSGARCRGADAELFFGPPGMETRVERMRRESTAKAMCRDCPAVLACRTYALEQGEVYGVWGGLGEQERRMQLIRLGRLASSA
jgi:WhiB family redox-sensing transcriptional regulator